MTSLFKKSVCRWAGVALIPIGIALAGFFILLFINPDCDGFACMGYFILLVPFFLFGVSLLAIVLITVIVTEIYSRIKK